jgi:hypothetical protein
MDPWGRLSDMCAAWMFGIQAQLNEAHTLAPNRAKGHAMPGFALKVMDHVRFGSAAGCAAVAMPRRHQPDYSRATPLVRAWPLKWIGPKPHQGRSPEIKGTSTAGHSHRRTSGGKAEADEF